MSDVQTRRRPTRSKGPSRRGWIGTINNPQANSLFKRLEDDQTLPEGVSYVAFQLETGATGTAHYQVYIECTRSRYISWIKKHVSRRGHWEARKGTAVEASLYCTKDDTRTRGPWIIGKISKGSGARTDLVDFKDAIKSGKRKRDLWETHTVQMAKYRHMYDDILALAMPRRTEELRVVLLVGKTRTGKTRTVHDNWVDLEGGYWSMPFGNGKMWFDGLDKHKRVLMDDFAGKMSKCPLLMLLWLLDRYPRYLEIKGSHTWWLPNFVAITSNYHPRKWYDYKEREESYDALCSRFNEVMLFDANGRRDLDEDEIKVYWEERFDTQTFCIHRECRLFDTCQRE